MHKTQPLQQTADLITRDLREKKLQHQIEIMSLKKLINAEEKLIVAAAPGHSIFINKEEIEFLLKRRLTRAQLRLENVNQKLNQFHNSTGYKMEEYNDGN